MKINVDKMVIVLALALLAVLFMVIAPKPPKARKSIHYNKTFYITVIEYPEEPELDGKQDQIVNYYTNWYIPNHSHIETITDVSMEYDFLDYYYCTAYSPQETGSWATASGATLHRAEEEYRLTEPTTCAIDRSLHRFGDLFYIPQFDRVFVAEDTGSAVKGKHLDLGYTDLESVWGFPTGYYEVYSVNYIYTDIDIQCNDFRKVNGIRQIVYKRR